MGWPQTADDVLNIAAPLFRGRKCQYGTRGEKRAWIS